MRTGPAFVSFAPLQGTGLVPIPTTEGNVATGQSAYWAFELRNSTGSVLGVAVFNESATVFGTGNIRCQSALSSFSSAPASVMNSSAAAAIANRAGGTAFLASHPAANVSMELQGNFSFQTKTRPAAWHVAYSTCPVDVAGLGGSNPANTTFYVSLNAVSGTVNQTMTQTGTCPVPFGPPVAGSAPLSSALAIGASADSSGLASQIAACASVSCNFFNFTLASVGFGLQLGDLGFSVTTSTGSAVAVTGGAALVNVTGFVVAVYSFQTGYWALSDNLALVVTTTYILSLFEASGPNLVGDALVVTGSPAFIGAVSVLIS